MAWLESEEVERAHVAPQSSPAKRLPVPLAPARPTRAAHRAGPERGRGGANPPPLAGAAARGATLEVREEWLIEAAEGAPEAEN